ncbi:M23 family metallopeptidase [Phosphitispora sp. TUW77]|uniref:M23 family metallopeptidase n=1 Tax=Phosphitispora sp. TUW77 TaxID=3152361 RepID=UPI003AB1BD36
MKINIGSKRPGERSESDYINQYYKPASGKVFGRQKFRIPKWVLQLFVSGAVCLLVFGLFRSEIPFTGVIKNGIRYLLTYETDIQPVFYRVIQLASHVGNLEWPLIDDISAPTRAVTQNMDKQLLLPVSGNVIQEYGWVSEGEENAQVFHEGIDIGVPAGTEVKAADAGTVERISESAALGKFILVKSNSGELVRYANLSETMVSAGQVVNAGDIIAKTGIEGEGEPHLHFEVIINGRPVDPLSILQTGGSLNS